MDNVGQSHSESVVHVILQRNKYLLTSCRKHVNMFVQKWVNDEDKGHVSVSAMQTLLSQIHE
jgi:hypothetical protein